MFRKHEDNDIRLNIFVIYDLYRNYKVYISINRKKNCY